MVRSSIGVVVCLAVGSLAVACDNISDNPFGQGSDVAVVESHTGDECAPGAAPNGDEQADATCALKSELHVRDLGDPTDIEPDGNDGEDGAVETTSATDTIGFKTLRPLADPANGGLCNGKTGPGFNTCGASHSDNCCRATTVPKGYSDAKTKIGHDFNLGVYEVTSGRFAAFVDAMNGDLRSVVPAHARFLPSSRAEVDDMLGPSCQFRNDVANYGALTWPSRNTEKLVSEHMTDNTSRAADIRKDATPDRLHEKPVNCVTYYMAEAFCAWDGGRLPTNKEWAYAALGGKQRRAYPWGGGRTPDRLVTNMKPDTQQHTWPNDFPFFDNFMNAYHIAPPGNKPNGVARWGQEDMGGNVLEWMADTKGDHGIVRGGSWEGHDDKNSRVYDNYPLLRSYGSLGFRCAYGAAQPAEPPPPPPPPAARWVPVYRSYNAVLGDHLFSLDPNEGPRAGWSSEGQGFSVWNDRYNDEHARPLFRCRIDGSGRHFLSNDDKCEGHVVESRLGWIRDNDTDLTVQLVRCRNKAGTDHLTTRSPRECNAAGYRIEGAQGFARP